MNNELKNKMLEKYGESMKEEYKTITANGIINYNIITLAYPISVEDLELVQQNIEVTKIVTPKVQVIIRLTIKANYHVIVVDRRGKVNYKSSFKIENTGNEKNDLIKILEEIELALDV